MDDYHKTLLVAGLFCEGLSRHDIASVLSLQDETEVQAILDTALTRKYFHYEPVLTIQRMDEELAATLRNEMVTHVISTELENVLPARHIHIRVIQSPLEMFEHYEDASAGETEMNEQYLKAETRSLRAVAHAAGNGIARHVFDGREHIIGLNYGASVMHTVKAIPVLPSRITKRLTIASLFGDLGYFPVPPPVKQEGYAPCNEIVSLFADRIGAQHAVRAPLNVPAFIPHSSAESDDAFKSIHAFLTRHESYVSIFGAGDRTTNRLVPNDATASPLLTRMDTVITGVGSIDNYGSLTRFMPTWLDADESRKVLAYCRDGSIVGDLGGYLVPAPETSDKIEQVKTFLNAINRRLIAATVDDFKAVAERHAKNPQSGAGVVCIAAGARKARILNALLAEQSCPVSRLFIDSHCALALLHLLDPARYSALRSTHGKQLLTGGDGWSKATKALIPVED